MARKLKPNRSSWARFSQESTVFDNDVGSDVVFYEMFEPPALDPSDGDLDIIVESRTRLDKLAYTYYGDVALWWVIAERNNLEIPISELYPGMSLVIPDPKYIRETLVR